MPSKSGCKTTCSNSTMIRLSFFVAVPAHLKRNVLPVSLNIGDKSISPSDRVRNLGVVLIPKCQCLVTSILCALAWHTSFATFPGYAGSWIWHLSSCYTRAPLSSQRSTMAMGCFLVLIRAIFKDFSVSRTGLRSWCVNHINGIMLHHVCVNSIGWPCTRE